MSWRALPLVLRVGGELQLQDQALETLLHAQTKQVAVVGLFGPSASGKKLLLNTLLQPESADFTRQSDVLLWLWLPGDNCERLVLTSGSFDATESEGGQALALLLLLSSVLLYNVDGEIDAKAVEGLQWLESVAKLLRVNALQDEEAVGAEFHDHAPKFVWLGRNFKVKWLKGAGGEKLAPNEYLEACLAPEGGYGEAATRRNMLRMYLESYFTSRQCVALSRAVEGNGTEAVAPETPRSDLRPQFVEAVDALYADYLAEDAPKLSPKELMGHALNAQQFAAVLTTYVDAMNAGEIPTMQTASNALLEQEVKASFEVANELYYEETQAIEGQQSDDKAIGERELQVAHVRGLQRAMAHIREVRCILPDSLQKTLLKDTAEWEAHVRSEFQSTLERNTKLSQELCARILERVLPRNLEEMVTDLAARSREDFSDGLIQLLTQYKSDLRTALDEYSHQGSGPAVDACLEEALLQSVRTSIQKWRVMVLREHQKHIRSWQDEKEKLDDALQLAEKADADTALLTTEQKRLHEEELAKATQKLSELRRTLHGELNGKKGELERLTSEMTTMNLKHDIRVKNAETDLAWARSRTAELEKAIMAERQRKEEASSGTATRALEKERSFHKEERSLLVQQRELLAQTVDLERQLVQKKTKHVQKVFALQNEHAKAVDSMKAEQATFERQLKSQAKKDLGSLKLAHEREKKAVQAESAALDKQIAAMQEKLAVFAAEEEAARASAAANRDFFKSLPMIPLPLMQAPAPAAGEQQRARSASRASTKTAARATSFDDTSTSSASPTTRHEVPQSNDMCRQS